MKGFSMIRRLVTFLKKTLTKGDLVVLSFLMIATVASFFLWHANSPGRRAIILVDTQKVREIPLSDKNEEIIVQGVEGASVIELVNGRVRMKDSPCHYKTCVKMGWIAHEGEMICCMPNKVVIKIVGTQEGELDALSR
jgi:hypothetical protein